MSYEYLDTKAKIKAYTREILSRIGECKDLQIEHPEEYEYFIKFLFPRHPKYPHKFQEVQSVGIRKNPSYKQLEVFLHYNNGKIDGVSVLKNCMGKHQNKDGLTIATRFSVASQIKSFRNRSIQKCEFCSATADLQVDHEIPLFIELQNTFLQITKLQVPTEFDSKKDNTKKFKVEDSEFRQSWQEYHRTHAKLRMLCGKCNLGRNKK